MVTVVLGTLSVFYFSTKFEMFRTLISAFTKYCLPAFRKSVRYNTLAYGYCTASCGFMRVTEYLPPTTTIRPFVTISRDDTVSLQ